MFRTMTWWMVVGALVLSACSSALAATEPAPTPEPEQPVSSGDPTAPAPGPDAWHPQPGDALWSRVEVQIEQTELLTLESFPPQFVLRVAGYKGVPCYHLRVTTAAPDAQNRIAVDVYTVADPAETCIQMAEAFDINIPLGSLPPGAYSVWLNGAEVGEIVAP